MATLDLSPYQTMRLEDGEVVARLYGGRRGVKPQRPSDRSHAGVWGQDRVYILIPCQTARSSTLRLLALLEVDSTLESRGGDFEVLVLGSNEQIGKILAGGPQWARAKPSRKGQERSAAQEAVSARLVGLNQRTNGEPV